MGAREVIRYLLGDARERLADLPDESVHCCITSPPYWGQRAYKGGPGMIGLEPTFAEHLDRLLAVFREIRRVLRKDGTCFLNYGDGYAGRWHGGGGAGLQRSNRGTRVGGHSVGMSEFKHKDLMMMPSRVATALQQPYMECRGCGHVAHESRWGRFPNGRRICPGCVKSKGFDIETPGWWLRSEVVWAKPNPMPGSARDRPTSAHEKVFLLTKAATYFYDAEAVKIPCSPNTHARRSDGKYSPAKGSDPNDRRAQGWKETRTPEEQAEIGANIRNVWTIQTRGTGTACPKCYRYGMKRIRDEWHRCPVCLHECATDDCLGHFATFPPKLVEPCILAGTSEAGCCHQCGAPWKRVVEVTYRNPGNRTNNGKLTRNSERPGFDIRLERDVTTKGFAPTCECSVVDEVPPCTVLDPFSGSGTTGLVADGLGRDAVLIEISPDYLKLARVRIRESAPMFYEESVE